MAGPDFEIDNRRSKKDRRKKEKGNVRERSDFVEDFVAPPSEGRYRGETKKKKSETVVSDVTESPEEKPNELTSAIAEEFRRLKREQAETDVSANETIFTNDLDEHGKEFIRNLRKLKVEEGGIDPKNPWSSYGLHSALSKLGITAVDATNNEYLVAKMKREDGSEADVTLTLDQINAIFAEAAPEKKGKARKSKGKVPRRDAVETPVIPGEPLSDVDMEEDSKPVALPTYPSTFNPGQITEAQAEAWEESLLEMKDEEPESSSSKPAEEKVGAIAPASASEDLGKDVDTSGVRNPFLDPVASEGDSTLLEESLDDSVNDGAPKDNESDTTSTSASGFQSDPKTMAASQEQATTDFEQELLEALDEIDKKDAVAVREMEEEITRATNTDSEVKRALETGSSDYIQIWNRVSRRESLRRWRNFVDADPDRAERWKGHPDINHALEWYRKQNVNQEGPAKVSENNATRPTVPESLTDEILDPEASTSAPEAAVAPESDGVHESVPGDATTTPESRPQKPSLLPERFRNGGAKAKPEESTTEKRSEARSAEAEKKPKFFDERFEKEFGISKENLESIEGFERLSAAQQKMIFENLSQITLGSVREEAARLAAVSKGERRKDALNKYGKWLGSAVAACKDIYSLKSESKTETQKEVLSKIKTGGFENHKELLTDMIAGMCANGPRIHENVKGELVADVVNIQERATNRELRSDEWFAWEELNLNANELARTPASWRGRNLGIDEEGEWKITKLWKEKVLRSEDRAHEKVYAEAEAKFNTAKDRLAEVLRLKGQSEQEIVEKLLEIDHRVSNLQEIQTDPSALKVLSSIEDAKLWKEAAKSLVKGPGLYMALGFVGRTVGAGAMGVLAAPIIAGGVAAIRSWDRTEAEIREKDRAARMGVKDSGSGALNVVDATEQIRKLEHLMERCRTATGEGQEKLIASLRERTQYLHDKQMLKRVNYGGQQERYRNITELSKTFSSALALLESQRIIGKAATARQEKINTRLGGVLAAHESQIVLNRVVERDIDKLRSVNRAALFSIAGSFLANGFLRGSQEFARSDGVGSEARVSEVSGIRNPGAGASSGLAEAGGTNPSMPELAPYTIEKGDTLTDIVREKIPQFSEMKAGYAQENAIANILKSLTPEEAKRIGIAAPDGSFNVDKITAGKTLNLEEFAKIVEDKKSFIERASARFGEAPFTLGKEDLGDFSGAANELDSDTLNKDHSIRESVIPTEPMPEPNSVPHPVAEMPNAAESGDRTPPPAPESVTNISETVLEKKVAVVQKYFSEVVLGPGEWSAIEKLDANTLLRNKVLAADMPLMEQKMSAVLQAFTQEPYKMGPQPKETVSQFLKRAFAEVVKRGDEVAYPRRLNKLLWNIEKTHA